METRNVLIIDDELSFVQTLGYALKTSKEYRYNVSNAHTAEEALQRIESGERFDVLLLDFYLPGKNGAEFLRHIRGKGIEWPVICVSVSQDYRVIQEFLRCEADEYIAKEQVTNGYAIEKVISAVLEKKQIQRKVAELQVTAHRMDAIMTIVRTVQHELNNPMAIIQLFLSRLQSSDTLTKEEYQNSLSQMREAVERMSTVLRLLPEFHEEVFDERLRGPKIYSLPKKPPS